MHGTVCVYAQPLRNGNVPERCGPYGELFFFLLKKEPMVLRELVRFGSSIPVEAGESMCIGRFAHDGRGEFLADGRWLPRFRRTARVKTTWGNDALFVIGLHGSGDTIALSPTRLGGGRGSLELPYRLRTCCAKYYTKLKGDVAGLVSERVLLVKEKDVHDWSF